MRAITDIIGFGPVLTNARVDKGFSTTEEIAAATPEELATVPGISLAQAAMLIGSAKAVQRSKDTDAADALSQPRKAENNNRKGGIK